MKNTIFTIFTIVSISFFGNAQVIDDDFEYYDLGDIGLQNPTAWSTWSGIPDDGTNLLIVDDFAPPSGQQQQAYIGPNSNQNCLLSLGNSTLGLLNGAFSIYIPSGSNASMNIQGTTETNTNSGYQGAGAGGAGVFNSDTFYFDGTIGASGMGVFTDFTTGDTGIFPLDEFFAVQIDFDLDNIKYHIRNVPSGLQIDADPVPFQTDNVLGGINFTSTDSNTNYWLDWIFVIEIAINDVDDFSATNFKLYPNPVDDVLNIESAAVIDEIEVYDILGNMVLERTPNAISPSIDMSALNSGVYLVNVTIDDATKTFKILK